MIFIKNILLFPDNFEKINEIFLKDDFYQDEEEIDFEDDDYCFEDDKSFFDEYEVNLEPDQNEDDNYKEKVYLEDQSLYDSVKVVLLLFITFVIFQEVLFSSSIKNLSKNNNQNSKVRQRNINLKNKRLFDSLSQSKKSIEILFIFYSQDNQDKVDYKQKIDEFVNFLRTKIIERNKEIFLDNLYDFETTFHKSMFFIEKIDYKIYLEQEFKTLVDLLQKKTKSRSFKNVCDSDLRQLIAPVFYIEKQHEQKYFHLGKRVDDIQKYIELKDKNGEFAGRLWYGPKNIVDLVNKNEIEKLFYQKFLKHEFKEEYDD